MALATAEEEVNGQDLEVVVEENAEDEILAILLMVENHRISKKLRTENTDHLSGPNGLSR